MPEASDPSAAPDTEELVIALMQMLCARRRIGMAAAAKRLGLRQSQMERLLLLLCEDGDLGGLGFVQRQSLRGRMLLTLSPKGEALCIKAQAKE